ncbi:MAG: CatB-related O-acetyltransferase [Bacteroidota bacterium]
MINSVIGKDVIIDEANGIFNSQLLGHNRIGKFSSISNSTLDNFTYTGNFNSINNAIIGKYCSIGPNFKVGLGTHPTSFISSNPLFYSQFNCFGVQLTNNSSFEEYKKTIIKNDVWIGANVFISEGVTIGNGAVIGAGSVVTKDVADYAIVGGVPARIIRYRFEENIIRDLLDLKWWDIELQLLRTRIDLFGRSFSDEDLLSLKNLATRHT